MLNSSRQSNTAEERGSHERTSVPRISVSAAFLALLSAVSILFLSRFSRGLPGHLDSVLAFGPEGKLKEYQNDCLVNRAIWKILQALVGYSELQDTLESYQGVRSHVSVGQLVTSIGWWYSCQIRLIDVSVSSIAGTTFARRLSQKCVDKISRGVGWLWCSSMSPLSNDNVIRPGVVSHHGVDYLPPPSLEVNNLVISWRSWSFPIIDVQAAGIKINVVVATSPNEKLMGMPLPIAMIGNTTLEDAIELLPPPPPVEGTYPRVGVINITNLTISVHRLPSVKRDVDCDECLAEKRMAVPIHHVEVPDGVFLPLLKATLDTGQDGVDRKHFDAFLKNTLIRSVRIKLLGEAKLRDGIDKVSEFIDVLQNTIGKKLHESGDAFESFVSEGHVALMNIWGELLKEVEKHHGLTNTMTSMKNALEFFEGNSAVTNFIDEWKRSLDNFRAILAIKGKSPLEEWKQGWKNLQNKWTNRVAPAIQDVVVVK